MKKLKSIIAAAVCVSLTACLRSLNGLFGQRDTLGRR